MPDLLTSGPPSQDGEGQMTETERPAHVGPARWRFAKLFEGLLKEETPRSPKGGWNSNSFSEKVGKTRQAVGYWCIGEAIPPTKDSIEEVIFALYEDLPGDVYEKKRQQLRGAWYEASQEPIPKEDPRAITRLRFFLMPPTLEKIVDLISHGQHTYDGTNDVIAALKCAPESRASPHFGGIRQAPD